MKFARIVYDELKAKGYSVVPVNSQTDKIGEDKCYQKISELPADIEHLLIITNKENTKSIVKILLDITLEIYGFICAPILKKLLILLTKTI